MAPVKDRAIPCEARIKSRWHSAQEIYRDGNRVTVLYDGRFYTLTADNVRERGPRHYTEADE